MTNKLHRAAKTAKNVYRGYMPIDLPQHRPPRRIKPWWKVQGRPRVTLYPKKEIEGYSETPEYPPLNDGTRKGVQNQIRLDWYESLKQIPTNDGKMHEIGRHSSHYIAHINNWMPNFNSLPMIQYLTQTNVIDSLPNNYRVSSRKSLEEIQQQQQEDSELEDDVQLVSQVRQIILDQIALDKYESLKIAPRWISNTIRDGNYEAHTSNRFIQNVVGGLKKFLALDVNSQLNDYQYDLSPAIRSWWYHSGFQPPNSKVFYKSRKDADGNINQMIQMDGSAALNIRADSLIEPVISQTDSLVTDLSCVPRFCHSLKFYGAHYKYKWPVALPGFWFEDEPKFDFPHTCLLSTDCLELRNKATHKVVRPKDDVENCLNGQAILTAFGWLNSLSMYQGYTPFQELDYPLTCQMITTDGKNWQFNVYQLNSHTFHRDLGGPKKNNICWTSGQLQLYEDYNDGEFKGVNDEVVKLIVRFLAQKTSPEYTSQLNLRPYLGEDTRSEEEKQKARRELRRQFEGRNNKWTAHQYKVPLFEHIFFRSKAGRNRITHMKAQWHIPKPKYPKFFE